MVIKRFGKRVFPSLVALALVLSTAGCFFNLSKEKDFKSWYFGQPGMAGALGEKRCDPYADRILGQRHPYYLHFRTLEVFYQPQGGIRFPERSTAVSQDGQGGRAVYACEIVDEGQGSFNFNAVDAGLVDVIIPYRKATAVPDEAVRHPETGSYPLEVAYNAGIAAVMKAPVYLVHDVLKTLYIPVAGTYFLFKSDEEAQTGSPADAQSASSAEFDGVAAPEETGSASETPEAIAGAEAGPAADTPEETEDPQAAVAAETPEAIAGAQVEPVSEASEVKMETQAEPASVTPSAEAPASDDRTDGSATDFAAMAPQATLGPSDDTSPEPPVSSAGATAETVEAAPSPTPAAMAAADDRAAETTASPSTSESAPSSVPEDVESKGEPVLSAPETVAEVPEETNDSSPAQAMGPEVVPDVSSPAGARTEGGPAPVPERASGGAREDAVIQEEDLTEAPAHQTSAAAAVSGLDDTIPPGEERPLMAVAGSSETPAVDSTGKIAMEQEAAFREPVGKDASAGMASVTESQETPVARPPVQLEEIRISKGKLTKQVAFLGFVSRSATVDPATKNLFENKLWTVLMDECSRRVKMLRPGDPRFPEGLTQLSRDQFGRFNSFELTTLARFGGINAVVTGSVIDIRLSNEISGILWYKEPEGALRAAILVEVYDAETGTKLLDKTLVHQAEVDELEPGNDGTPRDVDMPFLQEALDAIAEDMGDLVCDTLDDQPWRAFITRIDGARITLSAGSEAGLAPGNILTVYNSQIIDGLNNQQFFLTGERVGRLQIVAVYPDHSEANMIEDVPVEEFSLVLPER